MTEAQSQPDATPESTPNHAEPPVHAGCTPESTIPCFVGIDVAKAWLDVGVRPSGAHWRVANAEAELPALVERLRTLRPNWWCWRRLAGTSATRWPRWPRLVCQSW